MQKQSKWTSCDLSDFSSSFPSVPRNVIYVSLDIWLAVATDCHSYSAKESLLFGSKGPAQISHNLTTQASWRMIG